MIDRLKEHFHSIPNKKRWVDMVTAVLTIPVLLTVIFSNLGNLQKKEDKEAVAQTPEPTVERIIIRESENPQTPSQPQITEDGQSPVPTLSCIPQLPEYEIVFPTENENSNADPVCISLKRLAQDEFCPAVYSYRINNSTWSTYSDDPICLYNMAPGSIKLEVRVKSAVSGEEKTYVRNFTYKIQQSPVSPTIPENTPVPSL